MPEGVLPGIAKREQRSFGARCPSAALSDVRLCGHVSGLAAWPYVSRSLLAAPEEGHDLRSGAIRVGAECGVGGSLGDVLLDRPQYRVGIVDGGLHIDKEIGCTRCRGLLRTPQESDDLGAGAGHVGAERGVAGALGDAVFYRPQHRVVIVAARGNVGKRHGAGFGFGTASGTPQEGRGLRTGADAIRGEMGIIGSLGDAVFDCPIHGVLIIAASGYIHKHADLGVAVGFHKDDLDGMGSTDILKGVGLHRADALAVDLDVGDGIALIRGDGEGLISALTDADAAGGGDRAASPGSCLDGVVAVAAAATAIVAPVCRIAAVAGAALRDGDGHIILAVKPRAAPAGEGIAGFGRILESESHRFNGVGVWIALHSAAGQIIGNRVLVDCPLRRQRGYDLRNAFTGGVQVSVAAKPHKVAACISVRAGHAVGRGRGKLAAGFHDDVNSIGAAAQLAAAKVEGNGFQPVSAQCVSVQDFKDGAEAEGQVRGIVAGPETGRTFPPANRTEQRRNSYSSILSTRKHLPPVFDISVVLIQYLIPFVAFGRAAF